VDAHEFAAVFAASQRKFGAGKRFDQRFPKIHVVVDKVEVMPQPFFWRVI
jgi:hypothetical protein